MNVINIDKNMRVEEDKSFYSLAVYDLPNPNFAVLGFEPYEREGKFLKFESAELEELKALNSGVYYFGSCSAGGQIHFVTNSKSVSVHALLTTNPNMDNLSAIAQCGIDGYVNGKFAGVTRLRLDKSEYFYKLIDTENNDEKEVILNLPLYSGVLSLQIGLEQGASVRRNDIFRKNGRIVYYGTSIVQGASASRSGLCHVNLLSRALQMEVINFGFSGSAFGEPQVIEKIAKTKDASLFILDYEPNAGFYGTYESTLESSILAIRKVNPKTPILFCSTTPNLKEYVKSAEIARRKRLYEFQTELAKKLDESKVFFLDFSDVFSQEFLDCTIDGCHPNDLGFWYMTKAMMKKIKQIFAK